MSLSGLILSTLSNVGAPVAYHNYTGGGSTYVRFFPMPQTQFSADDDETYTTHYIQVDIFSPGNYLNLVKETKKLLKQAGFRKNFEDELYEKDTKLYHKVLRFYYITKSEEEI